MGPLKYVKLDQLSAENIGLDTLLLKSRIPSPKFPVEAPDRILDRVLPTYRLLLGDYLHGGNS